MTVPTVTNIRFFFTGRDPYGQLYALITVLQTGMSTVLMSRGGLGMTHLGRRAERDVRHPGHPGPEDLSAIHAAVGPLNDLLAERGLPTPPWLPAP